MIYIYIFYLFLNLLSVIILVKNFMYNKITLVIFSKEVFFNFNFNFIFMYDIKLFKNLDLFCIKKKSLEYIENTLYPYLKILYFFLQLRLALVIVFF